MRFASQLLGFTLAVMGSGWLAGCSENKPSESAAAVRGPEPASDPRAVAIADRVMKEMGGRDGWDKTRYLAWDFFGNQYQIWDKKTGDFHWEKDTLVANYNLNTKQGHVYSRGKDVSATPAGKEVLDKLTPIWINNSYWLVMPFKLEDPGVTLKYLGEGKTMDGAPADRLQMTFNKVGVTPENRYEVLVNRNTGLVDEWAYFPKAADAEPAFRRRWNEYVRHGDILLASGRSEADKPARFEYVTAVQTVPEGVMTSPTPVAKLK